ncbi:ABC transporter permease [uncultured Anaerotruncus sp.]|uniref:ABC transporter permease n=1 Tax=uncultured Anaerotruncus sp. TaxID=905011 RepID=UPI00280A66F6|nr:ABC transporter permease [uncultured Anaerotruncus sp.]
MLGILLSTSTLAATVRLSAPLALATMGSVFGHKAKIFNIGLESYVLTSAFFATWGSYLFESAFMGLLFGMVSGVVMSAIFGTFVLHFKSDPIVVGIAMNLSAWGLTSLLLFNIFHIRGSIMDPRIKSFGSIDIPLLGKIPFVGELLNNHNILVYAAFAVVIVSQIVMYKTRFGLRLRGVGLNEKAIQSAGVSVTKYKWASLIITGVLAGAAGACLPLSGISMFTENMSAGKGFLAVSAARIGKGDPFKAFFACLIFAFADAVSVGLQSFNIPSQLVLMTPYIATVVVMCLTNLDQLKKNAV